jgi:hypothetical protein
VPPFAGKKGVFRQENPAAAKGDALMFDQEQLSDLRQVVNEWLQGQCGAVPVEQAEQAAAEVARACGAAVVARLVPSTAGRRSNQGSGLRCACGGRARFVGYRTRGVGTLYGVVTVERAYYHCPKCGRGQLPWDDQQGLNARLWTPGVKALVTQVAARLPYQESVDLLSETLGFEIEDSSADEVVQEVGGRLRAQQTALMGALECGESEPSIAAAPRRLYVGMDGTSAHIDGGWHEVKTGVVYEGKPGEDGLDTVHHARYVAVQECSEQFGGRLYALAAQAGVTLGGEAVVIADGAEWIWNVAAHHYPEATQVVDYWHACEHVHALGRAYYGEGSRQGQRWAREHCRALKQQGPGKLLGALARMRPKSAEQAEAVRLERGYFGRNRQRMQYHKFRAAGMMIGSGPVEAACKVVVGQRLKGAGMRWSAAGADAMLAARAALLSGDIDLIAQAARAA